MRIAAGVLIIIAAVLDLIAGFGYAFVGGATAGGSNILQQAAQQAAKQSKDEKAAKEVQAAADKFGQIGTAAGGGLMAFGFYLLVLSGLGIAAAVVLFREKAATFALVVGVLQLVAEIIGLVIFMGANIILAIPGIVAGIFVIIAALGYRGKSFSALAQPQP